MFDAPWPFQVFAGTFIVVHLTILAFFFFHEKNKDASLTIMKFWFTRWRPSILVQILILLGELAGSLFISAIIVAVIESGW
jgi:hypothetical protein